MSSLTFGPEWLRALSSGDGGSSHSNTTPATIPVQAVKYKLAEFRYGREEMLALFSEDVLPPPELKSFEELTRGRPGSPLALQPLTEEEERSVHGGVNSALVVKIMGRGTPGRGRGGTRGGRGRSRGDGGPTFHRSISNEDSYSGRVGDGYGRRPWTESSGRGISSERARGSDGPVQGRGFDPRQRGFSESGPRANPEPWRSPGTEDEEVVGGPGWRISGQRTWRKTAMADTSQNWRQDKCKDDEGEVQLRDRAWGRYDGEDPDWKSSNRNDSLPEWCNDDDDADATPGTFDDSGQFRSHKDKNERSSSLEKIDAIDNAQTSTDSGEKVQNQESPQLSTSTNVVGDNEGKSFEDLHSNDRTKYLYFDESKSIDKDLTPPCETKSEGAVDQKPAMSDEVISAQVPGDNISLKEPKEMEVKEVMNSPKEDPGTPVSVRHSSAAVIEEDLELSMKDMEHIVAELDDEEEEDVIRAERQELPKRDLQSIQDPSILVAKIAEPGSSTIKGMLDWIYRDPQGEIQGPFPSEEMLEWFRAGYFTMGLLVRRVCDEVFLPLGDVIKLWNRVPFSSGPTLPPISSQVVAAAHQVQRQQYEKMLQKQAAQQQSFRGGDLSPTQQLQQQQQQLQRQQLTQQQLQQQQMRQVLLQQLQVKSSKSGDIMPRPQNLDISQEATIWGDSPVQSPRTEPSVWNNRKSPQNVVDLHSIEGEQRLAEKHTEGQEALNIDQTPKRKLMHDDIRQKKEQVAGKQQHQHSSHQQEVPVPKVGLEMEAAQCAKVEEKQRKDEEESEKKRQRSEAQRRALENLQQQQQKMRMEQQQQLEQKRREEEELRRKHQEELRRQQEQQHLLQTKLRQQHMQQQHQQRHIEMSGTPGSDGSPGWDLPPTSAAPSLLDIQRLEEEKQRAMLEKLQQLQNQQQQQLQQQQQRAHLSWASTQSSSMSNVKSLAEIQKEEAMQLAKERARFLQHQQQQQRQQHFTGKNYAYGGGAWNSATSHPSDSSSMFWDDVMNVPSQLNGSSGYRRSTSKNNGFGDSAFPSLSNSSKQTNRKKKEEEVVQRLFQPTSPSDEFIEWIQAKLPKISESVDVPTFVMFLQSIDSPYELRDYIQRYLGDNPDSRAFAKHFTDFQKRQNEAKKTSIKTHTQAAPVPITSPNETSMYGFDSEMDSSGKKKKKKKMQKVNPDLLGFSCNAATNTVNRGEIQFVEDVLKPK